MAEALYRKYRPQVFEDVVGQEPIERTLKNAIVQDKVSHAYLFCGPRGTGKTTTARLLAKALICEKGPTPDPDGTCEDCRLIADGAHPDVYELDAASRTGVENVREEIISRVHFAPTRGRYKVYIVDEVHMLSIAAFNALLKTLEEPPSHVVFVLCTTDPQKVPDTIHSRCQRFDFHRISPESMVARLGAICVAEGVEFEGEALDLIAQRAEGGLRNALTSLEQIIAFENGEVTLMGAERLLGAIDSNDMAEIMAYVGKRDIANCFRWTAAYVETGADLAQFVRDMSEHVRNLYVMALVGDDAELDVNETVRRELSNELIWFGPDRASRLLGVLGDLAAELKTSSNPRLAFEIALTRMVRPDSDLTLESLAERVEALESGYSAVAHVLPGDPYDARGAASSATEERMSPPARQVAENESAFEFAPPENAGVETEPGFVPARPPATASPMEQPAPDSPAQHIAAASSETPASAPTESARVPQEEPPLPAATAVAGETPAFDTGRIPAEERQPLATSQPEQGSRPEANAPAAQSVVPALSNPAALQRIWQAALADVRKRKQAHGVLFMSAKAAFDESKGMLRIAFPDESSFAFNAVQRADVQVALEDALAKAAGSTVPFYFEKGTVQVYGQSGAQERQPVGGEQVPRESAAREESLQNQMPGQVLNEQVPQGQAPRQGSSEQASRNLASDERVSPDWGVQENAVFERPLQQQAQPQVARAETPYEQAPYEQAPYEQVPYDQAPYDQVPYEDAPYDQVPYDDMAYDQVPYDDAGASYASDAFASNAHDGGFAPVPQPAQSAGAPARQQYDDAGASYASDAFASNAHDGGFAPVSQPAQSAGAPARQQYADAATTPSPETGNSTPDGIVQDDGAALRAMLQASFGEGVIFSEEND